MSQKKKTVVDADMLPEYDFSGAVRGKYYERYRQGSNVVLLDPDVSDAFPNAAAVNEALRLLVSLARKKVRAVRRKPRSEERSNNALQRTGADGKRGGRR
jgi:hypothetical protein